MNLRLEVIPQRPDLSRYRHNAEEVEQLISMYTDFYPTVGFAAPWVGYFVVNEEDVIVGSCSFVGAPANNEVEISYWTFKAFEGMGVGSFACRSLVDIAKNTNDSPTVIAKTEPRKNPSTRILEKNGFKQTEIVQDHEIGDAWLWRLTT